MPDDRKPSAGDAAPQEAVNSQNPPGGPMPKPGQNPSDKDKILDQANDYALSGDAKSHQEVTNANLHYGSREFVEPDAVLASVDAEGGQRSQGDDTPKSDDLPARGGPESDAPGSATAPVKASPDTSSAGSTLSDGTVSRSPQNNGHNAFSPAEAGMAETTNVADSVVLSDVGRAKLTRR